MKNKTTATILLLIGTVFWGMTFVFIKDGIRILNVFNFLGIRFFIACFILVLIFFKKLKHLNIKIIKYGILLSIPLATGFITQTIGLKYTSASKAGFITGLSVVFIPLFLTIYNKKIPKLNHIISILFATVGLVLLTLSDTISINKGDIWVFLCAIAFAIYIIMVGKITKYCDSILVTIIQLIVVGTITISIAIINHEFKIPKEYIAWQAIIFTSVFATALMFVIQNHYQKYISEIKAAIIYSFEPLFATITAYFYLQEEITVKIILGGILIFIGMIISELKISFYFKNKIYFL